MSLTQRVCDTIYDTNISFVNQKNISFLLIMLWGNNIHINQSIRDAIAEKTNFKQNLLNFLDDAIESGDIEIEMYSSNDITVFFSMMLSLGFGCSKQIRAQFNRGLNGEIRHLFNLGCKAYFEIKRNIGDNTISFKSARKKLIAKFSIYSEMERNRELTNPIYNYGPRMSDSNGIWRNDINKYVISIPMGGQNKKY